MAKSAESCSREGRNEGSIKQTKRSDEAREESLKRGILTAAIFTNNPTTRRKGAIIQVVCVPVNRKQKLVGGIVWPDG